MNHHQRRIERILAQHLPSPSVEVTLSAGERAWQEIQLRAPEAMQERFVNVKASSSLWPRIVISAAAALVLFAVVSTVQFRNATIGAHAVVETGDGNLLEIGNRIEAGKIIRTTDNGAQLALSDGSRVEMRSQSELYLEAAADGLLIHLRRGDVIVDAAKQIAGRHLYVQTKDVIVSVVGTVFLVNAEEESSRVSVIEGEVQVRQGTIETKLRAGEHVSTAATTELLALKEEIAWSPKAGEHLALLQQAQAPSVPETPRLRFAVESIRPCAPEPNPPAGARGGGGGGGRSQATPGRLYVPCVTLAELIKASYPVSDPTDGIVGGAAGLGVVRKIPGGPVWMSSDLYTVEAVTEGTTDALTMKNVMLPELLERRFQLKVHIETEQIPALALTIAETGLKIKPFQEGDCMKGGPIVFPSPTKPRCSMVSGGFNGANWRWEQGSNPLDAFLIGLSSAFRLPVINRTGNSDNFALIFEFGPDATTPGTLRACQQIVEKSRPDQTVPCLGQPTAPPIHTVLNQLGLRVEPVKAPREFIVVDRAERPSPN